MRMQSLNNSAQKQNSNSSSRQVEALDQSPPKKVELIANNESSSESNANPNENSKKELIFEGTGKDRKVYLDDVGLIENFMASDDLNECVEALLHKRIKNTSHVPNFRKNSDDESSDKLVVLRKKKRTFG